MAAIIDGKAIADACRAETKAKVTEYASKLGGKVPGLAVILVGERKDSQTYVRLKKKAAEEVGIKNFETTMPDTASQQDVVAEVEKYNADPDVHGILVQLPLPSHIKEKEVLERISPSKDVDGLHPANIGRLFSKGYGHGYVPCTPRGVVELLDRTGVKIEGQRCVVLGRSDIVGLPVSQLLLQRNGTVTVCHSKTRDLPSVVREADILVAAVGKAQMVKADWLKPGVVVIDVGTNAVDDPTKKQGYRLVGDVDFDAAKAVASHITPVPGGVGPMTIAMLLDNTLKSFQRAHNI
eukprot:RCo048525